MPRPIGRQPTPSGYKRCSRCKGDRPEKSYPVRKESDDGAVLRYSTCAACTAKVATNRSYAPYAGTPQQKEHDRLLYDFLRINLRGHSHA